MDSSSPKSTNCRERPCGSLLSEAVQTVNVEVQQVADRWHLVANMRETIEWLLLRQHAKLREAAASLSEAIRAESNPVNADSREAPLRLNVWQHRHGPRRDGAMARDRTAAAGTDGIQLSANSAIISASSRRCTGSVPSIAVGARGALVLACCVCGSCTRTEKYRHTMCVRPIFGRLYMECHGAHRSGVDDRSVFASPEQSHTGFRLQPVFTDSIEPSRPISKIRYRDSSRCQALIG